jgi:hypothetical protein
MARNPSASVAFWAAFMKLVPNGWNVVVLGLWNPGILTPSGIATRLYKLDASTEIGVEIPIDSPGPFRISHAGLGVLVSNRSLTVEAQANTYEALGNAMKISRRALESLPETPVTTAGYNVRYSIEDGVPHELLNLFRTEQDRLLGEKEFAILRCDFIRTVSWRSGRIQFRVTSEVSSWEFSFNFEASGDRARLIEWLAEPVDNVKAKVMEIGINVFALPKEIFK